MLLLIPVNQIAYGAEEEKQGSMDNIEAKSALLMENIDNGKALEKLKEFVKAQGGDISLIEDTSLFKKASVIKEV